MKIGFIGLLGLIFITLKLCNVIHWSWWFVLMPFYTPFVFALFVIAISVIFKITLYILEKK